MNGDRANGSGGGLRWLLAVHLALAPGSIGAAEYWVAVGGRSSGTGTAADPWDLQSAFNRTNVVRGGDTVWLGEGTYPGNFICLLHGTEENPVLVRGGRSGRVVIDGAELGSYPLTIHGGGVHFRDFEVTHSGIWSSGDLAPVGIQCAAPDVKLINLVVHDAGQGLGCWLGAARAEVYGCIFYQNGKGPREHGIYTQNDVRTGIKRFHDNIIFNNSGFGIHAYTQAGQLSGFDFQGNILFNNGGRQGDDTRYDNLFVGGTPPADQITVRSNYTYFSPGVSRWNMRFGQGEHQQDPQGRLVVADNYIVEGVGFRADDWSGLVFTNNFVYSSAARLVFCRPPDGTKVSSYQWDFNQYRGRGWFDLNWNLMDFDGWRAATLLDRHSSFEAGPPTVTRVIVRPNRHSRGRAHVVVYNWAQGKEIDVDASGVLARGSRFELRDVQNLLGPPVFDGVYEGRPLIVPLTGLTNSLPRGRTAGPPHTSPFFNVFLLTQ